MGFPSDDELKKMRAKLEKAEPSLVLSENATTTDKMKYKLCRKFVSYILNKGITQAELARTLGVDPSRVNEIVKYKIDLYAVDKLVELAEKLDAKIVFDVA